MFTKEQILEIQTKLASLGYRDTDFEKISEIDGEELVAIVKDEMNKVISINDMTAGIKNAITLTLNGLIEQALMNNYEASMNATFTGSRGGSGTIKLTHNLTFNGKKIEGYTYQFYKSKPYDEENKVNALFTDTVTESSRTYYCVITYKEKKYEVQDSFSTYYKIYYGFTQNIDDVLGDNKYKSITSSSSRTTYNYTCPDGSGWHFFIAIPPDVTMPTNDYSFTQNGAPVDMINGKSTNVTINGISGYTVYSVGTYSKDAELNVTVG